METLCLLVASVGTAMVAHNPDYNLHASTGERVIVNGFFGEVGARVNSCGKRFSAPLPLASFLLRPPVLFAGSTGLVS